MSALKPLDFQEATANRILEIYQQNQHRALVAEDVAEFLSYEYDKLFHDLRS